MVRFDSLLLLLLLLRRLVCIVTELLRLCCGDLGCGAERGCDVLESDGQ